ncbi:Uncharacterised protein [Mycobacteroides abscessus subsp. abscessus]|nr:Uncharacterised protein [Mycobacteroides abscessus subsp. abscessus]
MQRARQCLVLQTQHGFDEAGNACRGFEMADIGLHRPEDTRFGAIFLGEFESLTQPLDFDRIAQWRCGAVCFDVTDRRGVDLGERVGLGDDLGLPCRVRCGVVHLRRAVVVDRGTAEHSVDAVAVGHCVLEWFE